MKSLRNFLLTAGVVLLSGCTAFDSFSEIDELNEVQPVGSPFTQALAEEYKVFANRELNDTFDYPDALHFAKKGLAAAAGESVMPEPVNDWNLSEEHIKELGAARGRLIVAFDMAAREIAPATAAKAQVDYDCWIEQQEENWKAKEVLSCKKAFLETMNELEGLIQQAPQPVASNEPPPMVPEEAMYLVFFNWDSYSLSSGAMNVLKAVAEEVGKNTPSQINVQGYADTSGPADYNKKLAFKRGGAVRDALVKLGINADLINIKSHGEEDLLVPTPDNVREPANRRASISFE